ncbi:uncharacterized protein LOC121738150 [Aricia agestis]|uniref:uncharacterized protein LOC121738150 n=1 Tax=Aricia agestis TaxID=91739 RepID=UPI001C207757|nr:uncharacterized protein LOC121738150 [Aricia agestis]
MEVKMLLLLVIITAVYAENCSYIFDKANYHKHEILKADGLPTNLVYNPNTKDLHFTLIDIETLQNDNVQTKMDQYVLSEGVAIKIDEINGQAAAVDVKNDKVYIASDKGLYTLEGNETKLIGLNDEDIVQVFKPANSDEIYTVLFPDSEVYAVDLKTFDRRRIENIPCAFIVIVDEDGNIFYECDSKYVKMLLRGFQEAIEFVGIPKNSARALALDDKNRVILAANDGVYWLKADSIIPKKLMDLDFVPSGIAVGDNKIFLSTSGHIYEFSSDDC